MTTHADVLAEAQRLAALDGHHYAALTDAERIDYSRQAARALATAPEAWEPPGGNSRPTHLHAVADDVDPARHLLQVTPESRAAALSAAAQAASLQRMLDLHHLRGAVTHTDQGPAVLWHDVERLMPLVADDDAIDSAHE